MPLAAYAELVGFSGLKQSIKEEVSLKKVQNEPTGESESMDALSNMPDEFFAPSEPVQDELVLEEKTTQKSPFQPPVDTEDEVVAKKAPTLAEKAQDEPLIQEEQFYLEPIE